MVSTTPSEPDEPSHSNFLTSKRTPSTLMSSAIAMLGLAASRVKPSGRAVLKT